MLVRLAVAVNVFSAVLLIFAFLTWRRALAQQALVILAANTLLILVLMDASSPWQAAAMISLCAVLLIPQLRSVLQQRRLGKAWQGEPIGREPRRPPLRGPRLFRRG